MPFPVCLSFLAYFNIHTPVTGLKDFSSTLWPPLQITFQAYHLMVDLGMLFILIAVLATIYYFWGRRLFRTRWILWLLVASVFLTELATLAGWWTAEFGRQPWIVFNVLTTANAVSSSLTSQQLIFSVITFVVMYAILLVLFIYLLNKDIQRGPEPLEETESTAALPDTFRDSVP